MEKSVNAFRLLRPGLLQGAPVRESVHETVDVPVVLQVFDGQVAGGILRAERLVLGDERLDPVDAHIDLGPVVDVDVPRQGRVGLLVDLDDRVEQGRNPLPVPAHRGTDGNAQQASQLPHVQPVTLVLEFVEHVEGHHGPEVHVDELGRQVQVPFDVGRVHHVHHHVRHRLDEVLPHV